MKKLTAGIFAGILTIVTVSAADAAITSKAYVDGLVGANTTEITKLQTTVSGHTTDIQGLKSTVEGLTSDEGETSVAGKIADALGNLGENAAGEPNTVADLLGTKQDKSSAAYSMGGENGAWTVMSQAQQDALNSGITTTTVEQIGTNATGIATINTKLGNIPDGSDVAGMIAAVETAASRDVTKKLGTLQDAEGNDITVEAALATKQNTLGTDNVVVSATKGTGNVVSAVTAADGTVTIEKMQVIPEVTDTDGTDGTWVLTAKQENGVFSYAWEKISREADLEADGE